MPIYGEEKALQMARSILPSTARKTARIRKAFHKRKNRRKINQKLRQAAIDPEVVEDEDLLAYPDIEINEVRFFRRQRDKLAHYEKWAVAITKDLPKESRLSRMRTLLPKGLVGEHALDHLRRLEEFDTDVHRDSWWRRVVVYLPPSRNDEQCACLLYEIIENNEVHALFNQWMQHHHRQTEWIVGYAAVAPPNLRPLGYGFYERHTGVLTEPVGPDCARHCTGLGDIADFLRDIRAAARAPARLPVKGVVVERKLRAAGWRKSHSYIHETHYRTRPNPDFHPEWLRACQDFLERWDNGWRGMPVREINRQIQSL